MKKTDTLSFQLEQAILHGEYQPGDRLPAERILAESYNTSRNRMRETITRLETLGLLKTEPQSGTYVCNYPKEASFDLLIYLMENHEALNPEVFSSLMQVRELMETSAVNTIVTRKNRSLTLNKLREITEKIRKTDPEQIERIMELDYAFHKIIVEGSENIIFEALFRTSKTVHQFYTKAFFSHEEALKNTLTQHDALLLAIESGDADAAIEALCKMLEYGSHQVREYIGIKPSSGERSEIL